MRRLEVLRELVPTTTTMAVLVNPINDPAVVETETRHAQATARILGLQTIHILQASTERDLDSAFSTLIERRAGGLAITADTFFSGKSTSSLRWHFATQCRRFPRIASSPRLAA